MNKKSLILIVLAVLIIGTAAYFGFNTNSKDTSEKDNISNIDDNKENNEMAQERIPQHIIDIGEEAPDFTLEDLNGNKVSLKDYRGKIVLLNFWATWCPPCREEMPDLDKIYLEQKDEDFVVLAVNGGEDKKQVQEYITDKGFSFPVLLDTKLDINFTYNTVSIPTSFMLDKEGKIRAIRVGIMTYAQMSEMLENVKGM